MRVGRARGKFPEEERAHEAQSPGVVEDDKELERRLPPGARENDGGTIPLAAFPRRELRWTGEEGRASVDRSRYAEEGIAGRRGMRGKMPGRAERDRFMEAWRGATALLTTLKEEDPPGKPELRPAPDAGVDIHWRSGRDDKPRRVLRVESVAEAIRAYVGAGFVTEADAAEERRRLERESM